VEILIDAYVRNFACTYNKFINVVVMLGEWISVVGELEQHMKNN